MTKKDHKLIAKVLRRELDDGVWDMYDLIERMAVALKRENPKGFNEGEFLEDCGI